MILIGMTKLALDKVELIDNHRRMPLYEYQCECGVIFEALESAGTQRRYCADLCKQSKTNIVKPGLGAVQRRFSAPAIRGDGKESKQPIKGLAGQVQRPYSDCHDCHCENTSK